jgi:hypothetical protein
MFTCQHLLHFYELVSLFFFPASTLSLLHNSFLNFDMNKKKIKTCKKLSDHYESIVELSQFFFAIARMKKFQLSHGKYLHFCPLQ